MSYCHGALHPRAKLTDADVRMIRALREAGMSYRKIAERLGVAAMTAWAAANYWTWTDVR